MANQSYKCELCNQEFATSQALASHIRNKHPDQQGRALQGKLPQLDLAVSRLAVPMVPEEFNGTANVYWAGFNKGVSYGADTVLAGIRAAQELSSLGISQATPIIKMAQEMREAEGQAAKTMGIELGQAIQAENQQMRNAISQLGQQMQASGGNPFYSYFMPMLMPEVQKVVGNLMSMFGGQAAQGQQPGQGQPGQQPQGQLPQPGPQVDEGPPIEYHSIDEWED